MKIVAAIARYLPGLIFLVFGSNMFLNFLPQPPPPPGAAGEFSGLLLTTHYVYAVGAVMVVSAILLLANRFVGLALVLLAPVLVNILLFHILMMPSTIRLGLFLTLLWLLVAYRVRRAFEGLFEARFEGLSRCPACARGRAAHYN
jgi:putative oxidoreductase